MNKINLIIGGIIVTLLLSIGIWGGWNLHKEFKPCPTVTTDTIIKYDTTWYTIYDTIPIHTTDTIFVPGDTIIIPADVDTAAILKNYFSVVDYTWSKQDSNIRFDMTTRVTQNRPVKYEFDYKLLKPFTTVINDIDNSVTYSYYLQAGLSMPVYGYDSTKVNIQNLMLEATYVFHKGYVGAAWQPNTKSITARAGVTLFKINKVK